MPTIDPVKTRQLSEVQHESPLQCCICDPTGRFVFAGGRDRHLVCVHIETASKTVLAGHETWISSSIRSGAELVLTADYAGHVIAWDCRGETPLLRWDIAAHSNAIYALAASHDGKLFATGDRDGTIRVWQSRDGQRLHEIAGLVHPVSGLAFHPDGRQLYSADRQPQKPRIKLWDFAAAKELLTIEVAELSAYRRVEDIEWGGIRDLQISPDGTTLAVCGSNGYAGPACILLLNSNNGELQRKLLSTLKGFYYSAQFHPQGHLMAAGGDVAKGEFRIWNLGQDSALATVPTAGPCTAINVHPDGRRFVITQALGKGSYPDSGALTLFEFE